MFKSTPVIAATVCSLASVSFGQSTAPGSEITGNTVSENTPTLPALSEASISQPTDFTKGLLVGGLFGAVIGIGGTGLALAIAQRPKDAPPLLAIFDKNGAAAG